MCGISGELRLDGKSPDCALGERMLRQLARRGPDHQGMWVDGTLLLGQRRLMVLDHSERSNQPLLDAELGLALVFNGSIYNYQELRSELQQRGYRFFSAGDGEVILKAYAAWGEQCVEHLIGVFAFAIWERGARRLFLARDRLGIKPLYYSSTPHAFRFASNTQALLTASDVDTSLDAVALHYQLTLHAVVPAPRTIVQGIRKLPPATTMYVTANGTQHPRTYWQLTAQRPAFPRSAAEWTEAVHAALRVAVQRRTGTTDVAVGVLLSGGLDSSLLVALLAAHSTTPVSTFSIGFEDQPEEQGSEFIYSDQVAARYQTQHHKYLIANDEVLKRLPEAVTQMAEPMVGQDAVAFYLLAERVAQSVKVVQSGQGADEVFGGYFWYPRMVAEQGSAVERFRRHYFDRDHAEFLETVLPAWQGADYSAALVAQHLTAPGADEYLDQVLRFDLTTLIVDDPVKRVDNMTMAWGLETRVPFLDHELVELAMQVPPDLKIGGGGKRILKNLARGIVPDAVIDRPKGYFPLPALKFVRGAFLELMRDTLNSRASRARGIFQPAYLQRLLDAPEAHHTRLLGSKLWHVALLELWLQLNVDGCASITKEGLEQFKIPSLRA